MSKFKTLPSDQVGNTNVLQEKFPDYSHFGLSESMIRQVEAEVGIQHFTPSIATDEDLEEVNAKNLKAQRNENFEKEEKFLQKTLKSVKEKIKENEDLYYKYMDDVIKRGNRVFTAFDGGIDEVLHDKMFARMAVGSINQYKRSEKSPYFGKVIFKNDSTSESMELYFGKAAVDLDGEEKRVIDWRAPIADLYYKYTGSVKNAFFKVQDKVISGELKLKRQISIEEGLITLISDGNLNEVIKELENAEVREDDADEMLIANLDKSANKRLGEIVATIQSEQNDILRSPIDKITLVQGVAGAGKTTIALHRLAYILYNYPDEVKTENIVVIAPNDIFLDYISKVLPDLGVENINQTTIENFLLEFIDLPKDYEFLDKTNVSSKSYENEEFNKKITRERKIKTNLQVMNLVFKLKAKLELNVIEELEDEAYFPIHSKKLNKEYIRKLFYENRNIPWVKRIEHVRNRLHVLIENEINLDSMNSKSAKTKIVSEIENLDKFLSKINCPNLLQTYRMFYQMEELKTEMLFGIDLNDEKSEIENTINEIIEDIDSKIIYSDDLPILYKINELFNEKKTKDLDYVVVDEAQDLSAPEFYILKENTKENKLCIVGDINQTIHDEARFPTLIEQMSVVFGNENFSFHKLLKSYRSTIEITTFANKVLEKLKAVHIATPVIRHGKAPINQVIRKENLKEIIKEIIEKSKSIGHKSIVVTARTEEETKKIFELLKNEIDGISYIDEGKKNYDVGIHVMPSYLTKGLEFDSVIVVKNQNNKFIDQRELRLEYVMYTRALHELNILEIKN